VFLTLPEFSHDEVLTHVMALTTIGVFHSSGAAESLENSLGDGNVLETPLRLSAIHLE
jgi:hypothetical protein